MPSPDEVRNLIESAGGTVNEMTLLPDGHGFATASFPLRKDHWIYGDPSTEVVVGIHDGKPFTFEPPPMVFKCGTFGRISLVSKSREELAEWISRAGRYAIRAATQKGKDMDFDPDALIQNLVIGFLGYHTSDGLSHEDDWTNPVQYQKKRGE